MKNFFYSLLIISSFFGCKSIEGVYFFKNHENNQELTLNIDHTFEYVIDQHLIGKDTIIGTWHKESKIIILNKKFNNSSELIRDDGAKGCIKVVDNWGNSMSLIYFKINNSLEIYQTNINGVFCDENLISNIFRIKVFEEEETENDYGYFTINKKSKSNIIIKIDFENNDLFANIISDSLIFKKNKLILKNKMVLRKKSN